MREIVYIQAGNTSNYLGTHFWNLQQSYFTYGTADAEEEDELEPPLVDHDISWREGYSRSGQTYYPRLLMFDEKSNFGAMSKHNELYPQSLDDGEGLEEVTLWNGSKSIHRQDPIPLPQDEPADPNESVSETKAHKIRYWSDFNEVYHLPRGIHRLNDSHKIEGIQTGWNTSRDLFARCDNDNEILEDSVRFFLEECDTLQSLSVSLDTPLFGAFTTTLLGQLREEYARHPIFVNAFHSDMFDRKEVLETKDQIRLLNDAMTLFYLNELECLITPLSISAALDFTKRRGLDDSLYTSTEILSYLHESATLPSRLRDRSDFTSLASISSVLNYRGDDRIFQLSGLICSDIPHAGDHGLDDFSVKLDRSIGSESEYFATHVILRGVEESHRTIVDEWTSSHLKAYSYQKYLPIYSASVSFNSISRRLASSSSTLTPGPSKIPILSMLSTAPSSAHIFKSLAKNVEAIIKVKKPESLDVDSEELAAVKDGLWNIYNGYNIDEREEVEIGEDDI